AAAALGTAEPARAELSVTLLPASEMRALNLAYHGIDAPTDVLAFDLGEVPGGAGTATPEARGSRVRRSLLGDLYVCPDQARRSAVEEGVAWEVELLRLVIHGTLHLLGHEHPEDEGRYESEMFRLQERLLAAL
ncbi:MAG: rRNA maturation RNase YbeY, partial [Gemmatimonadota bacterium]